MTADPLFESLPIPLAAQIACVEREISMRERVYPRWTAAGKMTAAKAEIEIAAMKATLRTLQGIEQAALELRQFPL